MARREEDAGISAFYYAALVWLLAQVLGNLGATWLVPSSFIGLFLWLTAGIAIAIDKLPEEEESTALEEPAETTQPIAA